MKLSMITLGVADPTRALDFYRDGLGWTLRSRHGDLVTLDTGDTVLALYPLDLLASATGIALRTGVPGTLHSINVTEDGQVDRLCDRASDHGGSVVRRPAELPWGGYGAFLRDPDGHVWEIVHAR